MKQSLLLSLTLLTIHLVNTEFTELDFLSTFGYLDFGGGMDGTQDSALVVVPEDVKSNAITDFQRYYGLEETGIVDEPTRIAMSTPRCGVPDKDDVDEVAGGEDIEDIEVVDSDKKKKKKKKKNKKNKNKSRSRSKRYVTSATRWRTTKLSYRFLNYTADIPEVLTRSAFKEAFSMWEEVSALQFYEETNSNIAADIDIAYISGLHEDRSAFNSLVLAHAFFPRVGWLHMNDLQRWNYNSVQGTDTVFVAVHELGHILGLRHSKRNTIMHASYPGYSRDIKLSDDDIKGIQSLYGPNPCYPNNPCLNGGSCRKNPQGGKGAYVCTCTSGYKGLKCQNKVTDIMTRKCRAINIPNGYVTPEGRLTPNQVARLYCNVGYELVGASQFTCTFRGFYAPATVNTQCRRKLLCPALSLDNGEVYPRRPVESETVVSFSCNDDYQISGARSVKCRRDGTYDRTPPTCEKMAEEEEEEVETGCPVMFDAAASRTTRDSMIFAFKGSRYWIYRRGETGAPKSHWRSSAQISHGFSNIPHHLDAAFSYTDPDTRDRFMCFVKWPQVYFWDILKRDIARVQDFQQTFQIPGGLQITAAHRWDEDTIYFFVPFGFYVYNIKEKKYDPPHFQPMTTFRGMPPRITATAVAKSFYTDIFNLFVGEQVYQIRKSDKQVLRNNPYEIKKLWRQGLANCS